LYETEAKMNLTIRPARPADADVILEFNRLMAKETEHKDLDPAILGAGVAAMLRDPNKGRYFVAEATPHSQPLSPEHRGEGSMGIVGQLGITLEWSDWRNGNLWWIQSVYVAPDARRHGVFRKLYEHVMAEAAKEPNVIGVRLYVERENEVAKATYRKLGMWTTVYEIMEIFPLGY
jgi:ribosomal protein S18 acetylase RimI-like enzyme